MKPVAFKRTWNPAGTMPKFRGHDLIGLFLKRFPSKAEILSVLVACALPVFAWAIVSYLYALPGFLVRLSLWDTIGTASYPLAFALIESLVLLTTLVLLAAILPRRFLKDHFVAFGSAVVLVSSGWMMRANYLRIDLGGMDRVHLLMYLALYAVSLVISILILVRFERVEQTLVSIIDRMAVLTYFYLALGLVALVIVLIRNL
jgi:hypothetical protein